MGRRECPWPLPEGCDLAPAAGLWCISRTTALTSSSDLAGAPGRCLRTYRVLIPGRGEGFFTGAFQLRAQPELSLCLLAPQVQDSQEKTSIRLRSLHEKIAAVHACSHNCCEWKFLLNITHCDVMPYTLLYDNCTICNKNLKNDHAL